MARYLSHYSRYFEWDNLPQQTGSVHFCAPFRPDLKNHTYKIEWWVGLNTLWAPLIRISLPKLSPPWQLAKMRACLDLFLRRKLVISHIHCEHNLLQEVSRCLAEGSSTILLNKEHGEHQKEYTRRCIHHAIHVDADYAIPLCYIRLKTVAEWSEQRPTHVGYNRWLLWSYLGPWYHKQTTCCARINWPFLPKIQ